MFFIQRDADHLLGTFLSDTAAAVRLRTTAEPARLRPLTSCLSPSGTAHATARLPSPRSSR